MVGLQGLSDGTLGEAHHISWTLPDTQSADTSEAGKATGAMSYVGVAGRALGLSGELTRRLSSLL